MEWYQAFVIGVGCGIIGAVVGKNLLGAILWMLGLACIIITVVEVLLKAISA